MQKNSFSSLPIDLRVTSGKEVLFLSVGSTRFVFVFIKMSDVPSTKRYFEMVVSLEVDLPSYKGEGRQRGRGFDASAQIIGRTPFPFLIKHIYPSARGTRAVMLEFAVPEIRNVVDGNKIIKTAAQDVGPETLLKKLRQESHSTWTSERSSWSRKDFLTNDVIWVSVLKIFSTNLH